MGKYEKQYYERNSSGRKVVLGLIIVIAGILLLADNIGVLSHGIKTIFFNWPMLLIVIGLLNLFRRNHYFGGLVLILVGIFFMVPDVFDVQFNFVALLWPVLLIVVGILIIFRRSLGLHHHHYRVRGNYQYNSSDFNQDYIDEVVIFGGGKKNIVDQNFKGGRITCIFGGTELDFTNARLAEGTNVIDLVCLFGGASLVVPPDWHVRTEVVSILGGFADKRIKMPEGNTKDREIIIKGIAIFGGGDIKSFKTHWDH